MQYNNNKHLRCGNRKGLLGRNDQTHHRRDPNTMAVKFPCSETHHCSITQHMSDMCSTPSSLRSGAIMSLETIICDTGMEWQLKGPHWHEQSNSPHAVLLHAHDKSTMVQHQAKGLHHFVELLLHFMICHSNKCHRPRTSSCHKEQRGGTDYDYDYIMAPQRGRPYGANLGSMGRYTGTWNRIRVNFDMYDNICMPKHEVQQLGQNHPKPPLPQWG